jgi:hypothetical protein
VAIGLGAVPVASAQQLPAPFPGYLASIGAPEPPFRLRSITADTAHGTTHPLIVAGGIIGSALGLWGGIEAGEWMADHWGLDCCGDDPGLAAKGWGAFVGSAAGTMLGTTLGARLSGKAEPSFGRRLRDLGVGTFLGLALTAGTALVTDGGTAPFISFVVAQGGYVGLSNGRW